MQKIFYPYEYMSNDEKFKEQLPEKQTFYSFLTDEKLVIKNIKTKTVKTVFKQKRCKIILSCI